MTLTSPTAIQAVAVFGVSYPYIHAALEVSPAERALLASGDLAITCASAALVHAWCVATPRTAIGFRRRVGVASPVGEAIVPGNRHDKLNIGASVFRMGGAFPTDERERTARSSHPTPGQSPTVMIPVRAVRRLLKVALRQLRLRCVAATVEGTSDEALHDLRDTDGIKS